MVIFEHRKSCRNGLHPRSGFTLVELLVVIAIIGVLVALLLPAVQAAREAARRMSCQNNVKNLALAVMNYENQSNTLPAATDAEQLKVGALKSELVNLYTGSQLSWIVRVLPFLEQQALYDQFDLTETAYNQDVNLRPEENQPSFLMCPSDSAQGEFYESDANSGGRRFAKGNYAAYVSAEHGTSMRIYPGALSNEPRSLNFISDGTSNTILLAEVRTRPVLLDQRGAWVLAWMGSTMLAADIHSSPSLDGACGTGAKRDTERGIPFFPCLLGGFPANLPNLGANDQQADDIRECTDEAEADAIGMPCRPDINSSTSPRSVHPGGVNTAYLDGSVQWLSDEVDFAAFGTLICANDGIVNQP